MQKAIVTIAAAIALASPALAQEAPAHVTTIIIDTRAECGYGRIVDAKRATAEAEAARLARRLRSEGKSVQIIRTDGLQPIGHFRTVRVFSPSC